MSEFIFLTRSWWRNFLSAWAGQRERERYGDDRGRTERDKILVFASCLGCFYYTLYWKVLYMLGFVLCPHLSLLFCPSVVLLIFVNLGVVQCFCPSLCPSCFCPYIALLFSLFLSLLVFILSCPPPVVFPQLYLLLFFHQLSLFSLSCPCFFPPVFWHFCVFSLVLVPQRPSYFSPTLVLFMPLDFSSDFAYVLSFNCPNCFYSFIVLLSVSLNCPSQFLFLSVPHVFPSINLLVLVPCFFLFHNFPVNIVLTFIPWMFLLFLSLNLSLLLLSLNCPLG